MLPDFSRSEEKSSETHSPLEETSPFNKKDDLSSHALTPKRTLSSEQSTFSTLTPASDSNDDILSTHVKEEPVSVSISRHYLWETSGPISESRRTLYDSTIHSTIPISYRTTKSPDALAISSVTYVGIIAGIVGCMVLTTITALLVNLLIRRRRIKHQTSRVSSVPLDLFVDIDKRGKLSPFKHQLLMGTESFGLHVAAAKGNMSIIITRSVTADINATNAANETPLFLAAENGHFQVVTHLLKRGALLNTRNSKGQTALMAAAHHNHIDIVRILCFKSYNIDVNLCDYDGRTALHDAPYRIAKYLLSLGDRIQVDSVDFEGNTPLHLAVSTVPIIAAEESSLHEELVKTLLKYGAKINARNWKGRTPVIVASLKDNYEMLSILLDAPYTADINAKDNAGKTALIHAVEKVNTRTIEILTASGADINIYDLRGFTALHAAVFHLDEWLRSKFLWDFIHGHQKRLNTKLVPNQHFIEMSMRQTDFALQNFNFHRGWSYALQTLLDSKAVIEKSNKMNDVIHLLTDGRGNTIFHRSIMNGKDLSVILKHLINSSDMTDLPLILNFQNDRCRTVLHLVALRFNDRVSVDNAKALLEAGADKKIQDIYGRIPRDYSENQFLSDLLSDQKDEPIMKYLNKHKKRQIIQSVSGYEIIRKHFESEITRPFELWKRKNLLKYYYSNCYMPNKAYNIWQNQDFAYRRKESLDICSIVTAFVKKILRFVTEIEPRFGSRLILVGSARESTKINEPDEFDFDAILKKLGPLCQIEQPSLVPKGFVQLRRKRSCSSSIFDTFFNRDGLLMTNEINSRFQICIKRVLQDSKFWENEVLFDLQEDYGYVEFDMPSMPPRVCATIKLRINWEIKGLLEFKRISVDIVPCIHIDNWWPENAISQENAESNHSGCNLVFDQPHRKYPWVPYSAPCARISFAPLESQTVANAPAAARAAFMVAKQILQKPKHSYILKTCLLYSLEAYPDNLENKSKFEDVTEVDLNFWVRKLLKCYLLFCLRDFVPCYFMPDFHLPFTDFAKSNHKLLKILGVNGDNGSEILERLMKSRISTTVHEGYCAKICNIVDGILDVYRVYWSVCDDYTEVDFCLPNHNDDTIYDFKAILISQ